MTLTRLFLASVFGALAAFAQSEVYMYASPVSGNPVDLVVRIPSGQVYNVRLLIGTPVGGITQGVCYVQVQGSTIRLWEEGAREGREGASRFVGTSSKWEE